MINSLGLKKTPSQTRVVVAMSGGVDSSVVAAQLKKEGYEVIGITMQLYSNESPGAIPGKCCGGTDIKDAIKISGSCIKETPTRLRYGVLRIIFSWEFLPFNIEFILY